MPRTETKGAQFCPGKPLPTGRQRLQMHTLYGVAVPGDWVTVQRQEDGTYHWRQIRGPGVGKGSRGDFDAFLNGLKGGGV
ncbi:hypothetical protein WDJ50_02745 [Deinococcus sp. VB142]|uniref:Uncharacterized protein n=1 Tax=Deinococcus sp. VB142 TaxID=3112952 RepID=A0AAU6Q477_9DEIO